MPVVCVCFLYSPIYKCFLCLGLQQDKRVYRHPASTRPDNGGFLEDGVGPEHICYCTTVCRGWRGKQTMEKKMNNKYQ